MPKTKAMTLKPPTIIQLQGKSSFRMGPPPVPGKPVTTGKSVAVGLRVVGVVVSVVVITVVVIVGVSEIVGVLVIVGVSEMVGVLVMVPVLVVVGVVVVVFVCVVVGVVVAGIAQIGPVMVLVSNVTAPVCARARPFKLAPCCRPMDVSARIFPINEVLVPRVAELTTRHHTLHGSPPTTLAVPEVMRVDADLKIQTPDPLRVSVPDNAKASAQ